MGVEVIISMSLSVCESSGEQRLGESFRIRKATSHSTMDKSLTNTLLDSFVESSCRTVITGSIIFLLFQNNFIRLEIHQCLYTYCVYSSGLLVMVRYLFSTTFASLFPGADNNCREQNDDHINEDLTPLMFSPYGPFRGYQTIASARPHFSGNCNVRKFVKCRTWRRKQ